MKTILIATTLLCLASCATRSLHAPAPNDALTLLTTERTTPPVEPQTSPAAELTPVPSLTPAEPESRINVSLSNVDARTFFIALATGTGYTMMVHPNIKLTLSAQLKEVTLREALALISELYGIDYRIDGHTITVKMPTPETRIFQVSYLTGSRKGSSDTRVAGGSLADMPAGPAQAGGPPAALPARITDSSRVATSSEANFWAELNAALTAIAGKDIVISPQSGVVVVRAMPKELDAVTSYLKATQLSIERQVILEAKIIEVQLSDGYQSGINWAGFRANGSTRGGVGVLQPGSNLAATQSGAGLVSNNLSTTTGTDLAAASNASGTLFGLALQGTSFSALITFLETQGMVQVLSSPRISTLNNQQAVLKIGTDEFFVTGVAGGTTTPSAGGAITTTPNVTLRPFFSGVVLDVLPQIDANGNVILHIRPSVSQVSTVTKNINLGSSGQLILPLAASNLSEADSVVRARNGQVIVIGGLMRQSGSNDRGQVPGLGSIRGVGGLFGSSARSNQKRELVILLKPTVITNDESWTDDLQKTQQRLEKINPGKR